ncbi:MAG: DUF6056 family protein [Pseudonocardiaceae bacterium]
MVGAVLTAVLLAYMLLGNFARYVADDFGTKLALQVRSFWAVSIAEYRTHDGHFLATAVQDAAGLLNETFVRVLPAMLIAAWVGVLVLALQHLVPAAGRLGRLLLVAGIVYTTLRVTPSPFLALYWMTASLAYVVPLLLAAVLVWLVTRPPGRGRQRAAMLTAAALVAFLAAGCEETYTAAQTGVLTVALAVAAGSSVRWAPGRQRVPVLAAAWAGSAAGLAVMAVAPGNAIRDAALARIGNRPSLLGLPGVTLPAALHLLHTLVGAHWRGLLALALLGALLGARSGPMTRGAMRSALVTGVLATVGALVVVLCAIAPAELKEAGLPQAYAQIIPVHAIVCAVATLGWLGGRFCRALADRSAPAAAWSAGRRGLVTAVASLLSGATVVTGPIATLASMHQDLPAIQSYAATKDAQAAAARAAHAAGRTSATVPPVANPENMGVFSHGQELSRDTTYYINADEAEYYGIVTMTLAR